MANKDNKGLLILLLAGGAVAFAATRKKDKKVLPAPSPEGLVPRPDTLPSVDDESNAPSDDVLENNKEADLPMPSFSQPAPEATPKTKKLSLQGPESAEQIKARCEKFLDQMISEEGELLDMALDAANEAMMHYASDLLENGEYPLSVEEHAVELSLAAMDELIPKCGWKMMDTGLGPLVVFGPANTIDQDVQGVYAEIYSLAPEVIAIMNAFQEGDEKAEEAAAEYGIERID
jgi:hypothetical protein